MYASAGSSESECKIYKTTDMSTWSEIAAAKSWSGIVASNDGKILVGLSSDSANGGIYVALDGDAGTPTFARRY